MFTKYSLEWLDKHSAEKIPEAYCLSVGLATLVDATHAVYSVVEGEHSPSTKRAADEKRERKADEEKNDELTYSGD